jgi:cytosine/adenosine deaminase-related metal-dependent hydrolase
VGILSAGEDLEAGMIIISGCCIATMDAEGTEYPDGYVVLEGTRIIAVGSGPVPAGLEGDRIDGRGCLLTPGLVNTHHHLYQWVTRGYAQDTTLFGWLKTLYPVWSRITAETVHASAAANLGWMALTGCTTSMDHHYVFPADGGDLLEAEITAAREIGIRFHATRGSMDLGESDGGLPPDSVVEDREAILIATEAAIDRWHDTSFEAMTRVAVAPCSPFSVTEGLMRDAAELARAKGVRLHTHLAENIDDIAYSAEKFGRTPAEYAEDLGWLGPDVWMAHCVHLDDAGIARFAATGTGIAHCPTSNGRLGSGAAPIRSMLAAGVPVGLGVDGAASNESGRMIDELHQSLLVARVREGALALTARQSLAMATTGGAACLGREDELGSIEAGKLADLALWRVDELGGAGISDPICTLVFGAATLEQLFVGGRVIVEQGTLLTADQHALARGAARASAALAQGSVQPAWT